MKELRLEIEELEERIAPQGGHSMLIPGIGVQADLSNTQGAIEASAGENEYELGRLLAFS